jgi:tRNA A-37 threonylcarbamoyl transferase component Bud32
MPSPTDVPGLRFDDGEFRAQIARALGPDYELGALLGRGGFAEVYSARDLQLKRTVAVKVLRRDLSADPTTQQRFRREAEAVAGLRHPHIIPIYAVGAGTGCAFFVMPLVLGETLRARVGRGPLALGDARRILMEAAGALAAAHKAGMVHRDIKPDNIMLDGDEARVLLMDFGIAKAMDQREAGLTATGMIVGTPEYMSPEQGAGDGVVDARSDVYALGVVGYQMVTGRVPFAAGSVLAMLVKHATEAPRPLTELRPDCPADLAETINRCLAKTPEDRWSSADALLEALQATPTPAGSRGSHPVLVLRGVAHDPVRWFRRVAGAILLAIVVIVVLELLFAKPFEFSPLAIAIGGFIIAAAYGRLGLAGFSWTDVMRGSAGVSTAPLAAASDSAQFGVHAVTVAEVRADRGAMLGLIQRLPNSERRLLADVMPAAENLVARVVELGRQLHQLEQSGSKLDSDTKERTRVRMTELRGQLERAAAAMHQLRLALRRVSRDGVSGAADGIAVAVRNAQSA